MIDNLAPALRLLLVTDDAVLAGRDLASACQAAVRGGVTAVQLRLKRASAAELAEAGRRLLAVLSVPLFINDRLDVALAIGAAGVHLGPDDVPVALARRIVPAGFYLGASVGTEAEMMSGAEADYWGVGPWAATGTKRDAGGALGASGFEAIRRRGGDRPCLAIGGITPDDVKPALDAGAIGVAVVSGILGAVDVEAAARAYARRLG